MYLLFVVVQPLHGGIQIVGLVRADFGCEELRPDEVAQHLLQGLSILLVDAEQEEGQHEADHQQSRRLVADAVPGEHIGGYANQTARAEAYELPLGQIERHLRLYSGEVFRDRDKGHLPHLPIFRFCGGLVAGDGFCRKLGLNGGLLLRLFLHSVHFLPCLCNEDA